MTEKQTIQRTSPEILSELNRRVRIIETKIEQIQEKLIFLEKELSSCKDDVRIYNNFTQSKIQDVISKIDLVENEIKNLKISLEGYAKKNEIEKLKTMIELFNPIKSNFVTREEVKEEISKALNEFKIKKE